ncbi:MAG: D-alanyl-D-alanine carboxypeptidase/D-alanyl-D-alanine-endopeptidase [Gemmatimonadota bacterium]|nr:D-alanyl-D-alanine carboxypeptidase/D-alanyl-D-alanine-endopeptidase [Gemmatimonadota bacterium]
MTRDARSPRVRAVFAGAALVGMLGLPTTASAQPTPSTGTAIESLGSGLDRLLLGRSWQDTDRGVLVVSMDHGDTLYSVNPDVPLAPASNVKLLTTAAALEVLGPDYRFLTYLMTDGTVREDGVLDGDLILYGTGDPGLSNRFHHRRDAVFQELLDQLEASGIREVRGDLVADASFLPGPLRPTGWDPRDLNDHFTAPISALSFNENVVSMRISPAAEVGAPPRVQSIPDHAGLDISNLAQTVAGARPRVAILREEPLAPIRVEGTIGIRARDAWRQFTVPDPATFAASVFHAALEDRGVEVSGTVRTVDRPGRSSVPRLSAPFAGTRGTKVLARYASDPLRAYLEVINKQSHNLFAELVFRTIGRIETNVGSPSASARAVRSALARIGVDTAGIELLDGSGLSVGNRVTPRQLVEVLDRMAEHPHWNTYWATLPEAGRARELPRMYRTAAAGNLRAKTGTIERVSALSGVVRTQNGERLAFAIMLNGTPSVARAKAVENQIGARLARVERGLGEARAADEQVAASEVSPPASSGAQRHRIGPGENLTVIARQYGISLADLLDANPRVDRNTILAGQWLVIPRNEGEVGVGGG